MLIDLQPYTDSKRRFIHIAVKNEAIYTLSNENGYACCESGDYDDRIVLLFWSNKGHAMRARVESFENYTITKIALSDFIFECLPEMANDGVLAGPNFTHDLIGVEVEPSTLRDVIIDSMPHEMFHTYRNAAKKGGIHNPKIFTFRNNV